MNVKCVLMTVAVLGSAVGAGCEYSKKELDEMDKVVTPSPSSPLVDGAGPGWTRDDSYRGGEPLSGNGIEGPDQSSSDNLGGSGDLDV